MGKVWERPDNVDAVGSGLSLADRFCLALGQHLAATASPADTSWGNLGTIRQIR